MKGQKKKSSGEKKTETRQPQEEFRLRLPWLWLTIVVLVAYVPSINLGFTELDDTIFIKETHEYNEDLSNLITSFKRGVFNETEDIYYRPLLLNSFVLNYQFSEINIKGYHVVNILLHLISVLLLFVLFRKTGIGEFHAFLLTLIFAVHPVLMPAVAWIPGRNDTLLAVFTFWFFISAINFSNNGKSTALLGGFISLLAALFTKETALFAAPVAFLLLVVILEKSWLEKRNLWLYASWMAALLVWMAVRSQATLKSEHVQFSVILNTLPSRLPVLIQYLGKIILPVNLSVFPIMKDTSYIYGIISIGLLAAGIYFAKEKNWRIIITGILTYVLFLIPALLVPSTLNDQDFEHRLYLPIIGILLLLSQTILFQNRWKERNLLFAGIAIAIASVIMNFNRQKFFNDPLTFWKEAVRTSPHSAYANMMLGARTYGDEKQKSRELIRTAYALNPDEKYVNYYMGKLLLDEDSVKAAEQHFEKELKRSDYFECYFHLARIAFEKNQFNEAIEYLTHFLSISPGDPQGNNNLLLLYLQTNQPDKAREQAKKMQVLGQPLPPEATELLK